MRFEKRPTIAQFVQYLRRAQDKEEQRALLRQAAQLYTPLELYDCNSFTSGINKQCVDSLVRMAMRKSFCSDPNYPLRLAGTWLLACGYLIWMNEQTEELDGSGEPMTVWNPEGWTLKDPHDIESVRFVNGELRDLTISYLYSVGGEDRPGYPPNEGVDWVYRGMYRWSPLLGTATLDVQKYPAAGNMLSPEAISEHYDLDFWPFRGVQWYTLDSFIAPVITTILRYEVCWQNIAGENDRHSRRVKQRYGVGKVHESIDDTIEEGVENLPEGAKAEYLDTHPEGLDPMFKELDALQSEIRDTLGIIKVEELHNASGVSRQIEIAPLLSQCDAMRDAIRQVVKVIDESAVVHFGPLEDMSPQELELYLRALRSSWIDGVLTDDEYTLKQRLALDLPEQPVNGGRIKADRAQAQLQLMKPSTRQAV